MFDKNDIIVEETKTIATGFVAVKSYKLKHKLFGGGWSISLNRVVVVRNPAGAVLLYSPEVDKIVILKQFRVGVFAAGEDPWINEIVAGIIEEDESPEALVQREAIEEAGCQIKKLIPIAEYFTTPGTYSEKIHLYCGIIDEKKVDGIFGLKGEGEDIHAQLIDVEAAFEMIAAKKIQDATSIIALQWLRMYRIENNIAPLK